MARLCGIIVFTAFAGLSAANATLVDWSTETWAPGSLTNSYDVEPTNPGNDVTFTVSGDTGDLQISTTGPQTPVITSALEGGFSPAHVNLELALLVSQTSNSVTITINFSNLYPAGVAHVSFELFDIDFSDLGGNNGFQDEVRSISATSTTGTQIAPTITGVGPNTTHSGTGLNQVLTGMVATSDTGASSSDANATITFDTTDISSITFTYGDTDTLKHPTYQHIGIDNLFFEIVPEINPAWISLSFCGGLVVWTTRQRHKARTRAKAKH
jgi:hypothetical protein